MGYETPSEKIFSKKSSMGTFTETDDSKMNGKRNLSDLLLLRTYFDKCLQLFVRFLMIVNWKAMI